MCIRDRFYTLIEFKGEGTVVAGLETAFKRDERVIRYLTTKPVSYTHLDVYKRQVLISPDLFVVQFAGKSPTAS